MQGWELVKAWLSHGRIRDIMQPPVVASVSITEYLGHFIIYSSVQYFLVAAVS